MKTNIPEKLYVDLNDNLSDSILYGFTEKQEEDDIEYTRTDVIVERAVKYIANHFLAPGMDNEIEDFRKYMKGE